MKNNIIELPVRQQAIALPAPERKLNPLAVWRRNFVPEQDRMWVHAMKVLQERRAKK